MTILFIAVVNLLLVACNFMGSRSSLTKSFLIFFSIYFILPPIFWSFWILMGNALPNPGEHQISNSDMINSMLFLQLLVCIVSIILLLLPRRSEIAFFSSKDARILEAWIKTSFFVSLLSTAIQIKLAGGIFNFFFVSNWVLRGEEFGKVYQLFSIVRTSSALLCGFLIAIFFNDSEQPKKGFVFFLAATVVILLIEGTGRKNVALIAMVLLPFLIKKYSFATTVVFCFLTFFVLQFVLLLRSASFDVFFVFGDILNYDAEQLLLNFVLRAENFSTYMGWVYLLEIFHTEGHFDHYTSLVRIFGFPFDTLSQHGRNVSVYLGDLFAPSIGYFTYFPGYVLQHYLHSGILSLTVNSLLMVACIRFFNVRRSSSFFINSMIFCFFGTVCLQDIRGFLTYSYGNFYYLLFVSILTYVLACVALSLRRFLRLA